MNHVGLLLIILAEVGIKFALQVKIPLFKDFILPACTIPNFFFTLQRTLKALNMLYYTQILLHCQFIFLCLLIRTANFGGVWTKMIPER